MTKFLIVDGHSLGSRSFFVPNQNEFFNMMDSVIGEHAVTHVAFCFDSKNNWRKEVFGDYKKDRKANPERQTYISKIKQSLTDTQFQVLCIDGLEADDLCASLVALSPAIDTYVLSGDKDLLSLIDDESNVKVINYRTKFYNRKAYDEDMFLEEFGFPVSKYTFYKSLVGDSSDNIKGVKGIGKVNGTRLVNQFNSLLHLYEKIESIFEDYLLVQIGTIYKKLHKGKESAELAWKLVSFKIVPLELNYNDCCVKDFGATVKCLNS